MPELLEVSKRRHNFGTKRFKEKSLFIFHARIALKSLILLFVHLIARGARIGKTHTQTHRQNKYCNPRACAPRVNYGYEPLYKSPLSWQTITTVSLSSLLCRWLVLTPMRMTDHDWLDYPPKLIKTLFLIEA